MMTPLQFERLYQQDWSELESNLQDIIDPKRADSLGHTPPSGDRVGVLYRRACDHLALARRPGLPEAAGLLARIVERGRQGRRIGGHRRRLRRRGGRG